MVDTDTNAVAVPKMTRRRWDWRPKVRWFAAEILVIVAGVLIALALNAWWQQRQQNQEEQRLLSGLLDEFVSNEDRLGDILAFHRDLKETASILLAESAKATSLISADSVDQLLADVSWWASYITLESTVMDAAVLDGQLSLIQSNSLRRLLATWRSSVESALAMSSQEFAHHSETWLPLLRSQADIAQFANKATMIPGSGQPYQGASIPLTSERIDHRPLIRTRAFRNVLVQKLWIEDDIIYQYGNLEPILTEIIDELERETRRR